MKKTHLHTNTPRVTPLGCLIQNDHIMHVRYLSKTNKKKQDYSPSMTLFKVALQNDLGPSKNAKILCNIANHGYTMTHARPVYIQR